MISKGITLAGNGVGKTIIRDGITDAEKALITWTLVPNELSRMTGIEFRDGGRPRSFNGAVRVLGSYSDVRRMRIDHCRFDHLNAHALEFYQVYGVVDNNVGLYTATRRFANVWGAGGAVGNDYGDGAWTAAARFGTDQFLFFEDNTLAFDSGFHSGHIDAFGGARYVARHNTVTRGHFGSHGTESTGRYRGARAMEVYRNTFISDGTTSGGLLTSTRSGTILVHNNVATGYPNTGAVLTTTCDRLRYSTNNWPPWGNSDGTNPWDVNESGGPFYSGRVSSSQTQTITVSGASWAVNRWKGYSIKRTSGGTGASEIASNTGDSISFYVGIFGNLTFNPGDTFEIRKVRQSLDCPGLGTTAFFGGATVPIRPEGGTGQVVEPMYEWNNTVDGKDVDFAPHEDITRAGEHYFNDTVAPGYTPYAYPHPLTTGGPLTSDGGPGAPRNVRLVE
jgi:hypothetical protein